MTRKEIINSPDTVVDSRVRIAGTNWDRRRVVTKDMKRRMIQMYKAGKRISHIANHFDVSFDSVKRAVDESYNESEKARKREVNKNNKYYRYDPFSARDRADYKRKLLIENKKNIFVTS